MVTVALLQVLICAGLGFKYLEHAKQKKRSRGDKAAEAERAR